MVSLRKAKKFLDENDENNENNNNSTNNEALE